MSDPIQFLQGFIATRSVADLGQSRTGAILVGAIAAVLGFQAVKTATSEFGEPEMAMVLGVVGAGAAAIAASIALRSALQHRKVLAVAESLATLRRAELVEERVKGARQTVLLLETDQGESARVTVPPEAIAKVQSACSALPGVRLG